MQGLFSGVWGVSAIVGPAIGGLIVDHSSWRWVFYVNLPFGLLSALLLFYALHETLEQKKHSIDYLGAALLTAGISCMLYALLALGGRQVWGSPQTLGLLLASVALLGAFVWVELRAPEPIMAPDLFRTRIIAVSSVGGLAGGATMFGAAAFVPLFVQGVLGGSATNAGAVLAPMSVGWPIGSTVGARLVLSLGYRTVTALGAALMLAGPRC